MWICIRFGGAGADAGRGKQSFSHPVCLFHPGLEFGTRGREERSGDAIVRWVVGLQKASGALGLARGRERRAGGGWGIGVVRLCGDLGVWDTVAVVEGGELLDDAF